MTSFASLKQIEKCRAALGEQLQPVPIFARSAPTGGTDAAVQVDPKEGRLRLGPGAYCVMFRAEARWRYSPGIALAVVLGGDARFRGPRAGAQHELFGLESHDLLVRLSEGLGPRLRVEWDRRVERTLTGWGIVAVPPGPSVACELWASAELTSHNDPTPVTFTNAELLAIALANGETK